MKGFIEVNRTTEEEIKEGFLQTRWIDRRIKIAIKIEEISAFVDFRVYLKNGTSFSCDEYFEEIKQKIKEAQEQK